MFFGLFGKKEERFINKSAISQPEIVKDYLPNLYSISNQDSTSFACIDRIATEFASLNFGIYDAKTRQKVKKHPLYAVIKEPNKEDRHFNFFYQSAVDYYNGGCYWLIVKIDGEIISFFRLNPHQVIRLRDSVTNELYYTYNGRRYDYKDILYIPSRFGYSSKYGGKSIFDTAEKTFTTSKELEAYTQNSFKNGVGGKRLVIDVGKAFPDMSEAQSETLKKKFQSEYSGAQNSGRPLLKKSGIEFSELGGNSDNKAIELSENRKFQEHEISKIFGVPEGLINVNKDTNLENVFTVFNEFAVKPLATQFQDAINSLLDETRFYFEFDFNGLLKVSLTQRIDATIKQLNNGMLSLSEARALENRPPVEAGDTVFMPVNMMPWNEETKAAYMASQKQKVKEMESVQNQIDNPTPQDDQHFGGGDDKK